MRIYAHCAFVCVCAMCGEQEEEGQGKKKAGSGPLAAAVLADVAPLQRASGLTTETPSLASHGPATSGHSFCSCALSFSV